MKKCAVFLVGLCLLLCGCGNETPKLLTPIGETEDTAKVTRGEMYDIETYETVVTSEYENVKIGSDCIVGNVNAMVGDRVTKGQVLISMNNAGVDSQIQSVDDQIEKAKIENDYMNDLQQYDIQIAELELQKAKNSGDSKQVSEKEGILKKAQSALASQKIEQEKNIAQLQMDKLDGDVSQGDVVANCDGTVCYMQNCNFGDKIAAGTVVAVIAKDDSKKLFGEYIEKSVLEEADKVYAVINEKEYAVTNVPYDQFELASRTFWDLPLYSTFYFEDDEGIENGMYATIVVESNYQENVLQVPSNSVYNDDTGYYVYLKEDDKFVRADIKIGGKTDTAIEIKDGLKEGDEVYVKP